MPPLFAPIAALAIAVEAVRLDCLRPNVGSVLVLRGSRTLDYRPDYPLLVPCLRRLGFHFHAYVPHKPKDPGSTLNLFQ
jgi:hypothetical protein